MITIRGNSPNERRACTRPRGASRKLRPRVVVTLSPRYIQSPQQTLICVMRPAIFMLHLFAGNSSPADLTPRSQRPAAACAGRSEGMTPVWKILFVLNTTAGQERIRRLEQTMKGCAVASTRQNRGIPLRWVTDTGQIFSDDATKKKNPTEQNFTECHIISDFFPLYLQKNVIKNRKIC